MRLRRSLIVRGLCVALVLFLGFAAAGVALFAVDSATYAGRPMSTT